MIYPDLVSAIKQVRWSPSRETSVLLSEIGIAHGFRGKINQQQINQQPVNQQQLEAIATHHGKQVHGTQIIEASQRTASDSASRPDADGIYTHKSETIAIKTADCLPVLVASAQKTFACAIHAGWRGFSSGILLRGVDLCAQYGDLEQYRFVIGPAISRDKFEVGPEVIEALSATDCGLNETTQALVIAKGRLDRWHVDLQLGAVCQLLMRGISPQKIEVVRACTFLDTDAENHHLWNSYRREGAGCASNWSWIRP